ncbi:phosphatidylethanolamine N-methyltransferase family protein [Lentibacter algarum]|uniref:phosphatidylethanolamine N-methyltransferase family protein n=1 Tax=Lentibacter algarum TaxID=576131 RepID=UPI001C0A06A5|nr:phosphatidylethanolamine N-methyltransferase family protein [Lentibacter algarum]MBU2983096.1 phosphatidylethanolamine N-methyltransferase family protein [Lentibacter algarum]
MNTLEDIRTRSGLADLFEGQLQHIGIAILMTLGAVSLLEPTEGASLLGVSSVAWAKLSISLAILHQVIVALGFRTQLHLNWLTKRFGDNDMKVWALVFIPLLIARPISLIMVGWADATPITQFATLQMLLGLALLAPALWALHSTFKHFTIPRALGGDHFRDAYAQMPLVSKGIFAYTSNGMYGVAFLGLWAIALLFGSWNALVVALFQHAYIWVHMYCTERPDMDWIYGNRAALAPTDDHA